MANNRELSQLASLVVVDDYTKNIGIAITSTPNVGIGTTNPTSKLDVVGDGRFTGVVTATTFIGTLTGTASSIKGGLAGNIPYQSAPDTTAFLVNGDSGTILQSNGVGAAPTWVAAAPSAAITGLTLRDEGTIVGGANSVSTLNFVGAIVSAASTAGIATITFLDYVSNAGVSTYATNAGIATYATNAGIATYATNAGIATYATNAGIATYATNAGIATYATNAGVSTYATNAGIATYATNAGIATYATSAGIATYATNAGIATNLKGGVIGNIPYQSGSDTTVFLTNGGSGTILQSNGVGAAPTWVAAAPAAAITGLTIRDEGTIVGGANSVSTLNFVGAIVSAASTAGIATITFLDYVSNAGMATALTSFASVNTTGILTATRLSTGASGTGINIDTNTISGPSILNIDPAGVGDNTGAVRIKGDLYVDGTQFIVNSSTIELADLRVGIATTVGTNVLLDGGGIGIGSTNILKTILWNNTAQALTSSEDWNLASGKQYEIGGTPILSATQLTISNINASTGVTTLGQLNVVPTATSIAGLFSGTTSSDMVRITQLGSGNALVVEDSANPDLTPFVVTGIGSVGIGTNNPSAVLHVRGGSPWFSPNTTGAKATALRLGSLNDGRAAYDIITDDDTDVTTDNIEIQSNRYTGRLLLSRNSPSGIQTTFDFYSSYESGSNIRIFDITGSTTKIKLDEAGNTFFRNSGAVLVGTGTSTGTANQIFQVDGNVYIAGDNTGASLGIGITNPTYPVDIRSSTSSTAAMLRLYPTTTTRSATISYQNAGVSNMLTGLLNSAGASLGISGLTAYAGVVGLSAGTSPLLLVTNALERVRVFDTGEVGIGTTVITGTASQLLQVTGGAYISGNLGIGITNPQTRLQINGVLGFGDNNIKIGNVSTGSSIAFGSGNFFAGSSAGRFTTDGFNNNFLGNSAGIFNITGSDNNFFGQQSGYNNTTGYSNNFIGGTAGYANTTGLNNNFFGYGAGNANTSGSDNIYIGQATGNANLTGSENVIIGKGRNAPILNGSNQLVIGAGSTSWITGNSSYNVGIGTTRPTSKLTVTGDVSVSGVVTATSFSGTLSGYASSAGISTNLNGGLAGNIVYQSGPNATAFLVNGTDGFVLRSNGVGNAPTWVAAAPSGAVSGITVRDSNNNLVGTSGSVTQLTFGTGLSVTGTTGAAGIATITLSSNIVGTSLSITGVSTFTNGPVLVGAATSTGTASQPLQVTGGAYVSDNLGIGTTLPSQTGFSSKVHISGGNLKLDTNNDLVWDGTFPTSISGSSGSSGSITFNAGNDRSLKYTARTVGGNISDLSPTTTQTIDLGRSSLQYRNTWIGGNLFVGTATSTGTASQALQVNSGAYFNGNIGIGTTNPPASAALDVHRQNAQIFARNTLATDNAQIYAADSDYYTSFKATILSKNGTAAAGNVFGSISNADLGFLAFQNTTNALIYTNGGTPLIIATNSIEAIRVDSSQRVGIGTASPAFKADIAGDARVTSTNKMRFGGTAGTTNFYIQYNSTTNSLDFVAG